jgi:hypothetical protein
MATLTSSVAAVAARAAAKAARRRARISLLHVLLCLLLCIRCAASGARSFIRDVMFIAENNLLGRSLPPSAFSRGERAQTHLWLLASLLDAFLATYRVLRPGWRPNLRALRCRCDPAVMPRPVMHNYARLEYPPVDLDAYAPQPLSATFLAAVDPWEMPVRCRVCGCVCERVTPESDTPSGFEGGVLALPRAVQRLRDAKALMAAHHNYREAVLVQLKSYAEVALATAFFWSGRGGSTEVPLAAVGAGLFSACVSVHRVWLAAS